LIGVKEREVVQKRCKGGKGYKGGATD